MSQKPIYILAKDYLVSGEEFQLQYDSEFELLITNPCPAEEDLGKYYESENYISHTDEKKGVVSFLYQTVKNYSLKKKVNLIKKLHNGSGKLLDIGAGTGDFLVTAKNKAWDIAGVEINPNARRLAKKKSISLESTVTNFKGEKFDVITMWHVLEHISNYKEVLETCHSLLNEKGVLVIAVPNYKSYDAQYYKNYWAAYDVPRHLWHFSRKSLPKILKNTFQLISIKPMVFDSFYVSLLSEKYKTGKKFSLRAFWVGLQSNRKARKTKEYSSLIYCFRKS
ncbi:class I SAM-dependent methyltransferase [Rasiella sp. SM2506]|uniref:class I SAM-dependent methyltransferase n=1 Tax=Rasiella sp. SM2506 TaxID=3423914 RepID=UPI003D79F1B5